MGTSWWTNTTFTVLYFIHIFSNNNFIVFLFGNQLSYISDNPTKKAGVLYCIVLILTPCFNNLQNLQKLGQEYDKWEKRN